MKPLDEYNKTEYFIAEVTPDDYWTHQTFKTEEEALEIIRSNPDPLAFYIFTSDDQEADQWLKEVPSGTACVNNAVLQFNDHHLPFGFHHAGYQSKLKFLTT